MYKKLLLALFATTALQPIIIVEESASVSKTLYQQRVSKGKVIVKISAESKSSAFDKAYGNRSDVSLYTVTYDQLGYGNSKEKTAWINKLVGGEKHAIDDRTVYLVYKNGAYRDRFYADGVTNRADFTAKVNHLFNK